MLYFKGYLGEVTRIVSRSNGAQNGDYIFCKSGIMSWHYQYDTLKQIVFCEINLQVLTTCAVSLWQQCSKQMLDQFLSCWIIPIKNFGVVGTASGDFKMAAWTLEEFP